MLLNVKTNYGALKGVQSVVENVAEFRGIPYAMPPTGENRWKEPQTLKPWSGIKECNNYGNACIQPIRKEGDFYRKEFYTHRFHKYPPKMDEDCLYLNVWTSAESSVDKLPVFVWIHGGGFIQGYSHEPRINGEVIASKGIVVVSVNYRLNIFGFFAHPELADEQEGHCGNYAIMDQIKALEWIYENISVFGGDPENITVAGQSAGSFSVEILAAIPQTKGKIKRAIMQSGVIAPPNHFGAFYRPQETVADNGKRFMKYAGKANLSELRMMDGEELMRVYLSYASKGNGAFAYPCEDNYVLVKNPLESFALGEFHVDSMVIGATRYESQLMPKIENVTKDNYKEKLLSQLPDEYDEYSYMSDMEIIDDEDAEKMLNSWFAWYQNNGSLALCDFVSQTPGRKAYSYSFERNVPGSDNPGPFHSSCIWYAFGNLHNCKRPFIEKDFALEYNMNSYWINFIKSGDPNGPGLPEWKAYMTENPQTMILDIDKCHMENITLRKKGYFALRNKLLKKV